MKILLIAPGGAHHINKWIEGLNQKGIEVLICSLIKVPREKYLNYENIKCIDFGFSIDFSSTKEGRLKKLQYLKVLFKLKKIVKDFKPDIIHAHYLSSNGLIGALLGFKPYIISVWGGDIYTFPHKSIFHKFVAKFALKRSDIVLSTSNVMARVTRNYTKKPIFITPFGIDPNLFKPKEKTNQEFIIGTVKALSPKYGIDTLIKAFSIFKSKYSDINFKLHIYGDGRSEYKNELIDLTQKLDVQSDVIFFGFIDNKMIPDALKEFDIYAALSNYDSESFGVAVVEAMACEKAVVVSDVDGFKEVVVNNKTGIVVPRDNALIAAEKFSMLYENIELRKEMGRQGRIHVLDNYVFDDNLNYLCEIYQSLI